MRKHKIAHNMKVLRDVRGNFPGAEEPVKRWQGSMTPVVAYF